MVRSGNASSCTCHEIFFCNPRQRAHPQNVLGFDLGLAGKSRGVFKLFSSFDNISWLNFPPRQTFLNKLDISDDDITMLKKSRNSSSKKSHFDIRNTQTDLTTFQDFIKSNYINKCY